MIRSEDDYPNRGGGYDFGERAYRITSRERRGQSRVRDGQRSRGLDAKTNRSVPPREKMRISNKDFIRRRNWLQFIGAIAVVVLVSRLAWVQLVAGPDLSAAAQNQRTVEVVDAARRGAILDRNGAQLAFTMEARSITVHPNTLRKWIGDAHKQRPDDVATYDERLEQIAKDLPKLLDVADIDAEKSGSSRRRQAEPETEENSVMSAPSRVSSKDILEKLRNEDSTYEVLVRNVDPDKAAAIVEKYPELVAERQDIRQYPNGATAANVIGKIGMDGVGQFGFEASRDATLQGINGGKTIDIASNGVAIPGSTRDVHAAVDGTTYELTLDLDMQYFVQQQVNQAKANSGAKDASAVVLDAKTGEVLAMAQADTANTNKDMGGVTVRDAWEHGTEAFTTTGVFGKSSNVGTLMLAERLGQDRFAEMLHLFGLGQSTGIELPSESSGFVPQRPQWSGGTFANLPIGQGMAMTLLQMTGVFQAIANDGERIPPRMIRSTISPDGTKTATERPETVRVVSPETAQTVRAMFEGVMQSDPTGQQSGTAAGNSIEGYSLTGKTGTAQKFDPDTGAYSNSKYHITFAGIAPADDPRFVIGIMLDEPQRGVHGDGGQSAAPLFKDIAAWALNRYNVPPSPPREGKLLLQP